MCHTEPVVGRVLGEAEPRNAEGEHRRAGHFQVQPSLLDFGEMDEEVRFDDAGAPENLASRREELFIAEGSEGRIWVHERKRTPRLFAPRASARLAFLSRFPPGARDASAQRCERIRGRYKPILSMNAGEARSICEFLVNTNRAYRSVDRCRGRPAAGRGALPPSLPRR